MKIGFIGLGIMGKPMCKNLIQAGYELVVSGHSKAAAQEIAALGAKVLDSDAEIARECPYVITMLPNSPQVRQVALGEGGLIEGMGPGSVLIDMSSIDPMVSREVAAALAQKGAEMLDAPVSGGEAGAIAGTLSVMVGGKQEVFDQALPVIQAMAKSVVRVGEIGSGNIAKLANQIIVAVNIAGFSEALSFAVKAGADPELVYQAIRGGLAGSNVMDAKVPSILERKFIPGFKMDLHVKDLTNAMNAAHSLGAPLPMAAQVLEMMTQRKFDGGAKEDHSGLIRYYEKLAGVTVEKPKN